MPAPTEPDWTTGPAKWAAVLILAIAAIGGMSWSILARQPHPRLWSPTTAAPPIADAGRPLPDAPAPLPAIPPPEPPPETEAAPPTRIINLNTATAAELELLPSIGPALAQRIIEDRTARGPFKSIDNLDRVRGIGPETIRKLRPLATVE